MTSHIKIMLCDPSETLEFKVTQLTHLQYRFKLSVLHEVYQRQQEDGQSADNNAWNIEINVHLL